MDFFFWLGIVVFVYYTIYLLLACLLDCDLGLAFVDKFGKSRNALLGKVIWITGASSGIGEHLALKCAEVGAKLVLSARRQEELERVKKECIKISGGKLSDTDVLVLPLDISEDENHQSLFNQVISHFTKLDILVNNAGRSQRAIWEEIEIEVDRSMFELNVLGLVNLSRIAVKYFLERGEGHLAVTSSTAGLVGVPYSGTYTATKHALHGYFNSLRIEKLSKNLTVTIFCPGPTVSNFLQESFTGKLNEKYGHSVQPSDKRITGERCGYLFAVSLANKLDEAWVAPFPIILISYLHSNFPNVWRKVVKYIGPKMFLKLRDSRVSMRVK